MKKIILFITLLITIGFVSCKKEYRKGNLKDYGAIDFDSIDANSIYIQGDTLFYTGEYSGLNYIPIGENWATVSEIQQYLATNLITYDVVQSEPVEIYDNLAEITDGQMFTVSSNSDIPDTIISLIQNNIPEGSDLVFLIDKSGSMSNDLFYVKQDLNRIIDSLPQNVRISAAAYSDNICEIYWYHSMQRFTKDFDEVRHFINAIYAEGGCSAGESVYDAIYKTVSELNWESSTENALIIIGDEPPIRSEYSNHSYDDVVALCQRKNIVINLYPILTR
ncbi:MAG: VWA domain-containing protein [Chloroflexia bacterium]|nr:VWA domain-containing protein [Chloroflexia bacterium]